MMGCVQKQVNSQRGQTTLCRNWLLLTDDQSFIIVALAQRDAYMVHDCMITRSNARSHLSSFVWPRTYFYFAIKIRVFAQIRVSTLRATTVFGVFILAQFGVLQDNLHIHLRRYLFGTRYFLPVYP
jgi:hypothetical protein